MHRHLLASLCLSTALLAGQQVRVHRFRQWLGGREVGGARTETQRLATGVEVRSQAWMVLSRLGQEIRQEVGQAAHRRPDGTLTFTWRVQLAQEPQEGTATWSPTNPARLTLRPAGGPVVERDVPTGALLWPEDLEARLREAVTTRAPVQATTFSFPFQQWNTVRYGAPEPDPLPGFPDAVRFTGEEQEGPVSLPVSFWFSPSEGELRHQSMLAGLESLSQRAELPPPPAGALGPGPFERTLKRLEPYPFQPWVRELTLLVEGPLPDLPQDSQQTRLAPGRWRLRRAAAPTAEEAAQPPVQGVPDAAEAPFLLPSPLVPFLDPCFDGLIRRLALPPGLSRWAVAARVNRFVFDWITEKDYTVGFASAREVCHQPRGDCTEHGVLAVALLRRLGVPARGVTGLVGLGDLLGLHFWVEVRLGQRWIPIDPTFDQAPASALRLKMGETDLADLGSVVWEGAAMDLTSLRWTVDWGTPLLVQGDQVVGPAGLTLRLPGAQWSLQGGILRARTPQGGVHEVQGTVHPAEGQLRGAQRLAGARTQRQGWWLPASRQLYMDLGGGRWLQLNHVSEAEAYGLLDQLMVPTSSS